MSIPQGSRRERHADRDRKAADVDAMPALFGPLALYFVFYNFVRIHSFFDTLLNVEHIRWIVVVFHSLFAALPRRPCAQELTEALCVVLFMICSGGEKRCIA